MGGEWMSRKFATAWPLAYVLCFIVTIAGTQAYAQAAPSSQTPGAQAQQPTSGQEPSEEESSSQRRKQRSHEYQKWTFNVGIGAGLPSGTTKTFVKGGDVLGNVGVARNANRYLGLRADFFFVNLPLRDSALRLAQASGANDHVYGITLDPIINIPVTKKYSGYFVIGPAFYHRSGKLDSSAAVPGSPCNPFWTWWGRCNVASIPLNGNFLTSSQNEFGLNFGGGVARKVRGNVEVFGEFRYLHGKHNNISTDVRPVTIGVRW
jgi:opacity protein-like surface antigen